MENLGLLHTEQRNQASKGIDRMSTGDMLRVMAAENAKVSSAVEEALPAIERAVELLTERMRRGGRMVYVGAGTSGRLGYMDAAECPPTFGISRDRIACVMAGGEKAVFCAQEKLEDETALAAEDLRAFGLTEKDTVVAAAASGRTPYCIGALDYARLIGAGAVSIACNPGAEMSRHADVAIEADTGAEVIMGSTRLKAGTAEKMIMNMLSTGVMIRLGRTWDNLMICLRAANGKVNDRALRLFAEATGCSDAGVARELLRKADGRLDAAVLAYASGRDPRDAAEALAQTEDVHQALEMLAKRG